MNAEKIYKEVKSAFCSLMDFKVRGESVEIITPFCTLNNKFVSLFISERKGKFIISDGGWIETKMYDVEFDDAAENVLSRMSLELHHQYDVKVVEDKKGVKFYYKVSENLNTIASDVFDMGNFVMSIVNSYCYTLSDKVEKEEREQFKRNTDSFLKVAFKDSVKFRKPLDDIKDVRFNAIITKGTTQLSLITYITGSNSTYFNSDIQKSIVYMEMAAKSRMQSNITNMIAIMNDQAAGFNTIKSQVFIDLLNEKTTKPIYTWTRREELLKAVG